MKTVPRNIGPKILFFQVRVPRWQQHAAELGLPLEQLAELEAQVAEARAAHAAAIQARDAARAATARLKNAVAEMAGIGAQMLMRIRTTKRTAGPEVYTLARIPAPAKKHPLPSPGKPTDFTAELRTEGALRLKWKCRNPRGAIGTMYRIHRRLGSSQPLEFLGLANKSKTFIDDTLPQGVAEVMYQVQALRPTGAGPVAQFNVSLGVSPSMQTLIRATRRNPHRPAA